MEWFTDVPWDISSRIAYSICSNITKRNTVKNVTIIIGAVCGLAILCIFATRFGYRKLGGGVTSVMIGPSYSNPGLSNEFCGPKVAQYTIYGMFLPRLPLP